MNVVNVIRCQYRHIVRQWDKFIVSWSVKIFPTLYDRSRYRLLSGKSICYLSPKDLNQKLFWLNRYWQPKEKVICADKYRMREYLSIKNLEQLAVPLIGVWENCEDIDFSILPCHFVLKCNHGCAYNIVCRDKASIDFRSVKDQLKCWMEEDYGRVFGERHYSKINRCVICEEYLGEHLIDYKVYCFNGVPTYILICFNREDSGDCASYSIFSPNWDKLDYVRDDHIYHGEIEKPARWHDLMAYSESLSKDFPFVRLDYYILDDKIYLGEFTFTPQGNYITYNNPEIIVELGKKLDLSVVNRSRKSL